MKTTWPVTDVKYGSYDWFRSEVGSYLGYGGDFETFGHVETGIVDSCIQSGLKRFYFPPPSSEDETRHKWSFLLPNSTLDITSGTDTYDLPVDFVGSLEEFTYDSNLKVSLISEAEIRALKAKEAAANAPPKFAAVRPKEANGIDSQKWEVVFYPTPDDAFTLTYSYQRNPVLLGEGNQIPYGGTEHAETMLASCLAIAESRRSLTGDGRHKSDFMERVAGSIIMDQRLKKTTGMAWDLSEPVYGTYAYFARAIGSYLDFGRNPDSWTYEQDRIVNTIVQSGVRQFYFPPAQGDATVYCWSFLKPKQTLSLAIGDYDYDLPSDFGLIVEDVTYAADGRELRIEVISDGKLRSQRAKAPLEGAPVYCAVRSKATNYTADQTFEIIFYPTPDKVYAIEYVYNVNPPDMSITNLYPLGTKVHAETILASCLACAELERDGKIGDRHARFMERLTASTALDMKISGKA